LRNLKNKIMFWKRKIQNRPNSLGPTFIISSPTKPEFETMLEILRDAEKFDNSGEVEVSINTLETLNKYIENYITKKT